MSPRLVTVLLVSALLLLPAPVGAAQITLDSGSGWIQVANGTTVDEYIARETFSVNRPNYTIRGGRFDDLHVGDTIIFYVRVEDYFAWDCGWWYVYSGSRTVEINVTDPNNVNWTVGSVTTPSGQGSTGVANTSTNNFTAADFGGHFGVYKANFDGASRGTVLFTVRGEPRVSVSTNLTDNNVSAASDTADSGTFTINVTITDYNGTGITNLKVNATDVRTGTVWELTELSNGNYSKTGVTLKGRGDHVINVNSGSDVSEYALSGNGILKVSVSAPFLDTSLLSLPFFIQIATAIVHLLSKVSFYLALGFGIVIIGRGQVMRLLFALLGGRRFE